MIESANKNFGFEEVKYEKNRYLVLSEGVIAGGNPDVTAINRFRLYQNATDATSSPLS